jgi:hypothetical protein
MNASAGKAVKCGPSLGVSRPSGPRSLCVGRSSKNFKLISGPPIDRNPMFTHRLKDAYLADNIESFQLT